VWPLVLAVLVRITVWWLLPTSRLASDEESYYRAGLSLLATGEQDLFWPPGTVWLIAAAAFVLQTTDIRWLRLVWIALDIGCLLALRTLAGRVAASLPSSDPAHRDRFVTVVTCAYAIYLPAIGFAAFTMSETPSLLLTLGILVIITHPMLTPTRLAAAGALAGLLALTRPSVLPLLVFLPAGVMLARRGAVRLRAAMLFVAAGAAIVAGAVARNWWVAGEATIARNSAYNLYIGNRDFYAEDLNLFNPVATPEQIEFRRQYFGNELTYPSGTAAELQREALRWVAAHPGTFATRAFGRLARVFAPKTDVIELVGGEQRAGIFSPASLAVMGIATVQWLMVLVAGLPGLAVLWQRVPTVGIPFASAVLGSLPLCLIAIAKPRYAFGFEPILLIGAAMFMTAPRIHLAMLTPRTRLLLFALFAFLAWAWIAWAVFAMSSRLALAR
jgi:hypothetical protein